MAYTKIPSTTFSVPSTLPNTNAGYLPVPSGFTDPSSLSGLVLWLKADQFVGVNNDPVGTWQNQATGTGSAFDFTQATGAKQPLYKTNILNGLPGILGDGVDDWMSSTGAMASAAKSCFIVLKAVAVGTKYIAIIKSTVPSTNYAPVLLRTTDWQFDGQRTTGNQLGVQIDDNPDTSAHVLGFTYNGSGGSTTTNYAASLDGASKTVNAGINDNFSGAEPSALWGYVSGGVGLALYSGYIFELVAYEGELSATDAAAVVAYLRTRWGL